MKSELKSESGNERWRITDLIIKNWQARLVFIISLITITTALNQIFVKKYSNVKAAILIEERLDVACKRIELAEKKITILEKWANERDLKTDVALTEIKTKLDMILQKVK